MMKITIQPAEQQDSHRLSQLIALAFDENISSNTVAARMLHQHLWVALADGQIVGFVSGFQTVAQDGKTRSELDLLAVDPIVRGQGVGRRLVSAFVDHMHPSGACVRALVATDNQPMQRVMTSTGFTCDASPRGLYIASEGAVQPQKPADSHLIPVMTLTYSGIWLEGVVTPDAIAAAHYLRLRRKHEIVGALIPLEDTAAVTQVATAGFARVGCYHWWTLTPDAVPVPPSNLGLAES